MDCGEGQRDHWQCPEGFNWSPQFSSGSYWNYQSHFGFPSWPSPGNGNYESLQVENTNSATITLSPPRPAVQTTLNYSVKVMNVNRKSQYTVRKLKDTEKFTSVCTLNEQLAMQLGEEILDIGYIEPGHGMKGKQVWLVEDDDLVEMYERFRKKQEITLWCHVRKDDGDSEKPRNSRKRPLQTANSIGDKAPQSKRQLCAQTLNDVEEIVKKLKEKHDQYSTEKLNIWAHMLHIGKHDSYEVPPNVPYFTRGNSLTKKDAPRTSQTTDDMSTPSGPMSPGKRVSLRTECIDQLNKWHSLLEKGVITQANYDEVQQTILKDIMQDS